jgi:hypothetical protein
MPAPPQTHYEVRVTTYRCSNYTYLDFPASAITPYTAPQSTNIICPAIQVLLPPLNVAADCGQEVTILKLNGCVSVIPCATVYNDPNPPTYANFTIQPAESTTRCYPPGTNYCIMNANTTVAKFVSYGSLNTTTNLYDFFWYRVIG